MLKAVVEPKKNKRANLLLRSWRIIVWSDVYQKKKLEDLQKLFPTFYESVAQTFAYWRKLLEKPSIKDMGKGWRCLASYIFQLKIILWTFWSNNFQKLDKDVHLPERILKLTLKRFSIDPVILQKRENRRILMILQNLEVFFKYITVVRMLLCLAVLTI